MKELTIKSAEEVFSKSKGKTIAIIGDVMLDRYFWGSVSRISPESPVPVVDLEDETFHLGGAANVAHNLWSLGIHPLLCGVIGNDNSGIKFKEIAKESGIDISGLYADAARPTTVKTRIIGNSQHIARLDREVRNPCGKQCENFILDTIKNAGNLAGIIFEDYNKGAVSHDLIQSAIEYARLKSIPVFVDPKFDNFFNYQFVTVFKPNRKEAEQAIGKTVKTHDDIIDTGIKLLNDLRCENVLLTLGKDGMMLFESDGSISEVPTRARHIADVSGAGDTAIATLAAAYAGGAGIKDAASLANYAAGAVCERPGIVAITIDDLLKNIQLNTTGINL